MKKTIKYILIILLTIICVALLKPANKSNAAEQTLADGTYIIKSAINENYSIDIVNSSTIDGANVELWEAKQTSNQIFNIKYLGNGYYTITAQCSNKVMDVAGGGKIVGTNVQQYTANGTDAQQWVIKDSGDGTYSIISKCNGLYVDVSGGIASNGSNIQVYTGNGTVAQKFKFEKYQTEPVIPTGTKTLADGTYIIKSNINSKYCIDVSGASTNDCTNIQIWEYTNVKNQIFNIKYLDNGYYTITAQHSNKSMDVANGGKIAGTNVQQYTSNGTDAQKWIIKDNGDGTYSIISNCNGLYIDVSGGIAAKGRNIQVYTGNGSNAQKFIFEAYKAEENNFPTGTKTIEEGTYIIKSSKNSDYSLDISAGSKDNGANVQLWTYAITKNQMFEIKYLGNGYYTIIAEHSKKVLDVQSGLKVPGTNVQQYDSNGTIAQQWVIKDIGNGNYNIISKCNGLYLDVASGITNNGSNIQVYTGNGTEAQKFKFEKVEVGEQTISDGIYIIKSAINTNYVMDIAGGSFNDSANVQLWSNATVAQQSFRISYIGEGYYRIISINSSKSLDVQSGLKTAGTNVQQYDLNNSNAQQWIIRDAGNGYYNIISKCNNLYLDVSNAEAKNGANIQVYTGNGSNAQKFAFEKAKSSISIDTSKYPGYKEKVDALIQQHPNWYFQFLYTGLKFNDVVYGEYSNHKSNLIPESYTGEWICPVCGTTEYDSGWYGASEKAIAYYMDPRNFIDDSNVFQYQNVNEYIFGIFNQSEIQSLVNNSFLQNYAYDIDVACKNQNVNPYYIIARLFQEQGRKGTTIGKGMDGGDGQTYYNPFDIGANGDGYSEIYANALSTAKSYGWNSMEKAIEGGITFCKKNWLDNYQNTLYQNKFDIDTRNGSKLYAHQYMQNLMAAYSEGRLLKGYYSNTSKTDSQFVFIIPVYEGMNETVSQMPSSTGTATSTETYPMDIETTGTDVRIRSEASTESTTILRTLADSGTHLLSLQRGVNTNWQKIITTDGLIGYISGSYVKQVDDITTCNISAIIKTNDGDGCNVRVGPSTGTDLIGALPDYTPVTIIDNSTYKNITGYDWYRIILSDGRQAFAPSLYIK